MGKKGKKVTHTRREEQQGKRVMIGLGVAAVVLAILMIVAFAYLACKSEDYIKALADNS